MVRQSNISRKSGNNNFHSEAVVSKTVYIQNLPSDITKNDLAEAVKKFGRVRPSGIQLKKFEDGFCFGFVEFESPSSAKSAVEAHNINVRGNDAQIYYRKSGARAGNGTRSGGGFCTGNLKGQEKGKFCAGRGCGDDNLDDSVGGVRGFDRQNGEFVHRKSRSRDGRAYGGEAYPRNNWRNDEKWSNGDPQQRNFQSRNEKGKS